MNAKYSIQIQIMAFCIEKIVIFCVCMVFADALIIHSRQYHREEKIMNGFSDVRLLLRSEELNREHTLALQSTLAAPPGLSRWGVFMHRVRTRRALLELTPEQLRDIGLEPTEARHEGLKPFWR